MSPASLSLAAVAGFLAVLAPSLPASAQILAADPDAGPIRDHDEEKEGHSSFWEAALSPAAGTYEDLVAQAQGIISSRNLAGANEARTLLADAIAARPSAPLAHFWLGILESRAGNHAICASSLEKALEVDPDFTAPVDGVIAKRHYYLDYQLALCSALAGKLGAAAQRLHRIRARHPLCIGSRTTDCRGWEVSWRLGETLMALGRLEEAIESLREAAAAGGDLGARYTLAVALERDEQATEADQLLSAVASGDYHVRSLWAADKIYIPAEDEYYYRGLARMQRDNPFHARIMFRAYLKAAPKSPWRQRASAHLARVTTAAIGSGSELAGQLDMKEGTAAVGAAASRFGECVKDYPSQLFQVSVSMRLEAAATKPQRAKIARTVSVAHYDLLNVQHESTRIIDVTRCLREVAQEMPMPGFIGAAGATSSIKFYVAK